MAGAIQLTEVDFDQIKQNLVDYLKSTKNFTDYDSDGSNLQVILNLISYQAQLNAYSVNMVANESFLTSSSIRKNVVSNAKSLGYTPVSARSAKTFVDFEFYLEREAYPNGFPQYLQIDPGPAFNSSGVGVGMNGFIFNCIDTQVAGVRSNGICTFKEVPVYEGVILTNEFIVDESDYDQRFIIKNNNIDTTTIRVEIQEDPNEEITRFYREANNLVTLTQDSRVFWVDEVLDGYYQLTFGDGYFGKKLKNGAKINVTYLLSNGPLANGIQGVDSIAFIGKTSDSNGTVITDRPYVFNVPVTEGGSEVENVPSIKNRAPKHYAAQTRCVTSEDYDTIIREIFPAVDDIYIYGGEEMDIPQYGRVFVAIKPSTGEKLSTITKKLIKDSLRQFRVASIDVKLVDPEILYVEMNTMAYYDDRQTLKDNANIVSSVRETLTKYAESSSVTSFGGAVRYSKIIASIDDSDYSITRNTSEITMRKDLKAVENTNASYEVCFENPIKEDAKNVVVYSSGFRIENDGVLDLKTYYFENIPSCDPEGFYKLRLFYFDNSNQKIIVNEDFGDLDIIKGELKFGYDNPVTIVDTIEPSSIIEIRAIPAEQDIVARRSVYLSLDISKSNINAAADSVVSGS